MRAIRVGILIKGNLVEERLLGGPAPITLGQSLRCTLSVPVEGLPREHALFVHDDGRILLRITSDMEGRLSHGEAVKTFADLRTGNPVDGAWSVPLEHGTRGRLMLGDATILFQEMARPAIAPKPQLPASVRGTFADRIDRRLAIIIGASLAVHVGIACWASLADVEDDTPTAAFNEPMYRPSEVRVIDDFLPPPPVATEPTPAPAAAIPAPHPVAPVAHPTNHVGAHDPGRRTEPQHDAAMEFLTGNVYGDHGHNETSQRTSSAHLGDQIQDARDHGVTIGDDPRVRDQRVNVGNGRDPNVNGTDGPNEIQKGPEHTDHTDDGNPLNKKKIVSTLTAEMVLDKINSAYLPALRRCYQRNLSHDGSLRGKISVSLTVDGSGHVSAHSANGVSDDVDGCVDGLMGAWTFEAPKDGTGNPTHATFHLGILVNSD